MILGECLYFFDDVLLGIGVGEPASLLGAVIGRVLSTVDLRRSDELGFGGFNVTIKSSSSSAEGFFEDDNLGGFFSVAFASGSRGEEAK